MDLQREVESLLTAGEEAGAFLSEPGLLPAEPLRVGHRLGPYRILEQVAGGSDYAPHRIRFARALLELGETARARPVVERLLRARCREPELLELCKRRGIPV